MAEKNLNIRIKTIDKELKDSLKKIAQLEKTVDRLNSKQVKLKTNRAQEAAKRLERELKKANEITEKLFSFKRTDGFGRSIAKVRDELSAVRLAFDKANSAAERQEKATALIAGNFKKIRMEATAFAQASGDRAALQAASGGNVQLRLKEISNFPKTMLAGREAMGLLNRMLELSVVGSKDFLDISKAIGQQLKTNADIQKASDKAAGLDKPKKKAKAKKEEVRGERKVNEELQKRLQMEMDIRKIREKRIRQQEREAANEKRISSKRRQSQLLGAGFPLLFGGGAGAVGGSLLGSVLAPPGEEFGGQIFGSALGTLLERNLQKIREIGNAVKEINLDALEQSSIGVNRELAKTVTLLKQQGKTEKARRAIQTEVAMQTGMVQGSPEDIANALNLLIAEFQKFAATAAGTLGIISAPLMVALTGILRIVNAILFGVNSIVTATGAIFKEMITMLDKFPLFRKFLNFITKDIEDANEKVTGFGKKFDQYIVGLGKEKDMIMQRIKLGDKEAAIRQKIAEAVAIYGEENEDAINIAVRALAAAEDQEAQARKLVDLYKSIGQTVEDGLVNAIQGAIDGTKTLGDVARSVFREIQTSLIRFGVNSFLTSLFPGSSLFRANGGPVSAGKNYIVGERGPEMFMPNAGGRIVPNSDMGGSTNVVVNVDASGSNVQGDQQRGKELGAVLSVAIQSELLKQKRPGGLLA